MKLSYITFMVRDIQKTVSFYRDLVGLKIVRQFNPGRGEIVFMSNGDGETMLEFVQSPDVPKVSTVGLTLSFQSTEALEALRQKAVDLGYAPSELINHPPKPTHFTVPDPDGVCVEFSM